MMASLIWNLDATFWFLEDWVAPDPHYRSSRWIFSLLAIRIMISLPGLLECQRSIDYAAMCCLGCNIHLGEIIDVMYSKIVNPSRLFSFYRQLIIIYKVLTVPLTYACAFSLTSLYLVFIQSFWVIIKGWEVIGAPLGITFFMFGGVAVGAFLVLFPAVAKHGKLIQDFRNRKLVQLKFLKFPTVTEKRQAVMTGMAMETLKYTYGFVYPLGSEFVTSYVDNMVQDLMSVLISFDLHMITF